MLLILLTDTRKYRIFRAVFLRSISKILANNLLHGCQITNFLPKNQIHKFE